MRNYYVYMLANEGKTLCIGVTNNLERRMDEHKNKIIKGFTEKYDLTKLVYFEETTDVGSAIWREKQLKGWVRRKKIELIEKDNPGWDDLSLSWRI